MDKNIKEIIPPVDKALLEQELTEERFLRHSNKGGNHLYIVTNKNAPNVVREIGRLREITFREAGGGTGKEMDIDSYDISEVPYMQLVSWDPEEKEIIAGYRLLMCKDAEIDKNGDMVTATSHLFKLSEAFYKDYMPYTLELGRSFVQPKYQSKNPKGIFSLDNLWDGLGAIAYTNPEIKYFIGKVTMYPDYDHPARNMILSFMSNFFPDDVGIGTPVYPLLEGDELEEFKPLWEGKNYKEAYSVLNKAVREMGENIPPLINSYMNLTDTMKTFGTSINPNFGNVEETGILITIDDVYEPKKERYFFTYEANKDLHRQSEG
jgi:hypothetical protein